MAVTLDHNTLIFSVPQADLTLVGGSLYECDTNWLKQQMMAILASAEGIEKEDAFIHFQEYTVVGVTYARAIQIINGYSIEFTPDSAWSVRLAGSNNNFFDVENGILVQNQVQVIAQNSAGLIDGNAGSNHLTLGQFMTFKKMTLILILDSYYHDNVYVPRETMRFTLALSQTVCFRLEL